MSPNHQTTTTEGGVNPALVPKLRFPDFRWAEGWEEKRLGNEGDLISSLTGKAGADFDTGDARFVTYMNVFSNTFTDPNALRFVDVKEGENQNAVASGDVFFTISSETPEEVGMASVLLEDLENCYLNSFCALFRFSESKRPNPVFTGYLLRQPLVRAYFTKKAQGSTRFNLSKDAFRSLPLCIPSLAEQQKIAECLSSVDDLIAAQARKVDALKTHKKGLMQQLFPREGETQPRLRFPEFQNAGEWKTKVLGKVAENLDNKRRPITSSDREAGDVPYYGASGVVDYVEGYIFDEDLLCVSEDGANLVARTYPIAFSISGKTWVNNHAHVLRFEDACTQKFVEVYLNSIKLDDFITGMAQPKLNKAMLDRIPIPHTTVAEQQRIASCLSSLDALITAETQKHDALKAHKRGLMQQLFPSPEETADL
jgi:type I restriction enzyme S subunit